MSKLAICFYGQPRFLDNQIVRSCYSDIIEKYNADVYVHSWISESPIVEPLLTSSWVPTIYETSNAASKILEWLKPKRFKFDPPILVTEKLSSKSINLAKDMELYNSKNELTMLSHLKSVKESVNLIDTPSEYDFILVTRFDVMLEVFPTLSNMDSNKFYIRWQPNSPWWYDAAQLCGSKFYKSFYTFDNIDSIVEYLHNTDRRFYPELFKQRQHTLAGHDEDSVVYTNDLNYAIVRSHDGLTNVLR